MCLVLTAILGVVVCLIHYLRQYIQTMVDRFRGRLPLGPTCYPLIGTLGVDSPAPWLLMQKWDDMYGKDGLFTYFQGPKLHVAICSPTVAKFLYNDPRIDGKADSTLKTLFKGHGLTFSTLHNWRELRRVEVSLLKNLRKDALTEQLIPANHDALDMVAELAHQTAMTAEPLLMRPYLYKYIVNSLAGRLCGPSLRAEATRSSRFFENFDFNNDNVYPHKVLNVFPWLAHFPPIRQQQAVVRTRFNENIQIIRDVIHEHRETYDPSIIRDFIDASIEEQHRCRVQGYKTALSDDALTHMIMEMYFAGYGANLAMLEWSILLLSSTPRVQQRFQAEIHHVFGKNRTISFDDRSRLPYCEATMNEIFRIAVVGPVGVARRCEEDTPVPGTSYVIPKGATLFVNYYDFQTSEKYWKDSFVFRPERFLNEAGNYQASPNNYAFGIGMRSCPGDQITKDLIFVGLTTLLQHFTVNRADSVPWTEIPRINGISVFPAQYEVTLTHC